MVGPSGHSLPAHPSPKSPPLPAAARAVGIDTLYKTVRDVHRDVGAVVEKHTSETATMEAFQAERRDEMLRTGTDACFVRQFEQLEVRVTTQRHAREWQELERRVVATAKNNGCVESREAIMVGCWRMLYGSPSGSECDDDDDDEEEATASTSTSGRSMSP
ncbi:Aste57867_20677 [Aphanomyces stellatus]|uniref:Aste57867_20677 protein n=1 Tax=Aphanomyces stellatus TaxID=120398 RepID=A0A485LGS7_9STRA|nr:hypothetical protein As57867_020609 [Aphanomyces stellatus]VFT97357.1 Aste57867_20677 [Aphanomyces stellatus]